MSSMTSAAQQLDFVRDSAAVYLTTDRVVHVRGDDARSWLNGQITSDVRELAGDRAAYSLLATAKGRVVSDLWALAADDGMAIVLPASNFAATLAVLDKHVIMEDVELDADEGLRVIAVVGPRAREVASRVRAARSYDAGRLGSTSVDLWVAADAVDATLAQLGHEVSQLGGGLLDDAGWAHAHVALGVPRLGSDFGEQSYPQEAGLRDRALSFQKGCYRGQEVIYMLENRGQLARRLVQLELPAGASAAPGTQLEAEGKRVGEITSVAVTPSPDGATLVLGYVKRPLSEVGQELTAGGARCVVRSVVGATDPSCPLTPGSGETPAPPNGG
jgi:folate-binding protein YgfZ